MNPVRGSSRLLSAHERLLEELGAELSTLEAHGLRRRLTSVEAIDGPHVTVKGQRLVAWCSNDYLGLSTHPEVIRAAVQAAEEFGVGAQAARLLSGTTRHHTELERALAAWFQAPRALVFSSGYLANLGALGALLASGDEVFVDRSAHASLFDAARATRATLRVFQHNDVSQLAELLGRARRGRRRLIVTEGVFSMDGDQAPLTELLTLAEQHDAVLYVDDAHAAFVLGEHGRGSPEAAGLNHERLLYMGTLGKALGSQGGFVIGPEPLIDVLCSRAKTFLFNTAPAVPVVAAAAAGLRVLRAQPELRARLRDRVQMLKRRLANVRAMPIPVSSHIVPVRIGETRQALRLAKALHEQGVWAPAIRPPTVPEGTARLRLSITARHGDEHIAALAAALERALSTSTADRSSACA